MNAYVKGALVCLALILGLVFWYQTNKSDLPVNSNPKYFNLIDRMEKDGVPDFQLQKLDGTSFDLTQVKGKVVILNFWASWCNPCVQEFPSMIKLIDHFKGDVVLVAVSADEEKKDIESFLKAFGLPKDNIHVLWDKERKISDLYGVGKIPESFLVGKNGRLIRKVVGIDDWYTDSSISYFSDLVRASGDTLSSNAIRPTPAPSK